MTLEKHIIDTMKEWQIKIGTLGSRIRLYYPKSSLCEYLKQNAEIDDETLCRHTQEYLGEHAAYLGDVSVCAENDRFCILVGREGCDYVEKNIAVPEFLSEFLAVLKEQDMENIRKFFAEYAKDHGTTVKEEPGEDGIIFYMEDEGVEPYVYCVDRNEFGITYHRFTRSDYKGLL